MYLCYLDYGVAWFWNIFALCYGRIVMRNLHFIESGAQKLWRPPFVTRYSQDSFYCIELNAMHSVADTFNKQYNKASMIYK